MYKVFLTADIHFYDELIMKCERDCFTDVSCMNTTIINNWNKVVADDDIVYVLGDFAKQGTDVATVAKLLSSLKGRKRLVMGNHDNLTPDEYRTAGFEMVYDVPIIVDGFWIFSHEPLYITEKMPYANVFGHVHSNPNYKSISNRGFCACLERTGFTPVLFAGVKRDVVALN